MTITDPRFARETNRVPQWIDYEERPVLSSTIHPDIKRTLTAISDMTRLTLSQVTYELLCTGLIEMHEMDEL